MIIFLFGEKGVFLWIYLVFKYIFWGVIFIKFNHTEWYIYIYIQKIKDIFCFLSAFLFIKWYAENIVTFNYTVISV